MRLDHLLYKERKIEISVSQYYSVLKKSNPDRPHGPVAQLVRAYD